MAELDLVIRGGQVTARTTLPRGRRAHREQTYISESSVPSEAERAYGSRTRTWGWAAAIALWPCQNRIELAARDAQHCGWHRRIWRYF